MGSQYSFCAQSPSPLSTFIRHCNTMQSPHYPSYGRQGVPQPADSITDLNRSTASIENLRELQKYSEKLAYESTCCRLWAQGIQTQIQDEQEKVHKWIEGMTEDLLRAKRLQHVQPHWSTIHPCTGVDSMWMLTMALYGSRLKAPRARVQKGDCVYSIVIA